MQYNESQQPPVTGCNEAFAFSAGKAQTESTETTIPKRSLRKFDDIRREELHETIENFYQEAGLFSPIDNLLDSVQHLFNGIDGVLEPGEDGKQQRLYQMYSPDVLSNKVFQTFQIIRFLTELNERFEISPDNPKNIKRNLISQA